MNSVELTSAHWDRMMTHESVSENSRLAEITPDRTGMAQLRTTLELDRTTRMDPNHADHRHVWIRHDRPTRKLWGSCVVRKSL